MAHEIEIFSDGTGSFVSAREHAWHSLGTVVPREMTIPEALDLSRLSGWNVRKTPLTTVVTAADGSPMVIDLPDHFASLRTHPETGEPDILGVVGKDYTPRQNEECADLLTMITEQSGAFIETAGSLRGGRQIFVTMKLPTTMNIAGSDELDLYIAMTSGHDGKTGIRIDATPVRIVCANTQAAAIKASKAHHTFRHTSGVEDKIKTVEVQEALGITFNYMQAFEQQAEKLLDRPLTNGKLEKVCNWIWLENPKKQPKAGKVHGAVALKNHEQRVRTVLDLFNEADTNAGIRGTRWGGYQAIVEYFDHYADADSAYTRANAVATSWHIADAKRMAFAQLSDSKF